MAAALTAYGRARVASQNEMPMKNTAQTPTSSANSRCAEESSTIASANVMAVGQKSKMTLHSVCDTPTDVSLIRCANAPAKSFVR